MRLPKTAYIGVCLSLLGLGMGCKGGSHATGTDADVPDLGRDVTAASGGTTATGGGTGSTGGQVGSGGASHTGGAGGSGARGGSGGANASGGAVGSGGVGGMAGTTGPNCSGLPQDCGALGKESCCAISAVPGGTFNRSNNVANPATVSPFVLDKFEVTVGRFRGFIDSGRVTQVNPPPAGAGAHPLVAGTGWDPAWNTNLPPDPASLKATLQTQGLHNWSDSGLNDHLPMNYVTWFEAFAFCAWDSGRLPSEAEWNFAAAGGDEQRIYPWGEEAPDGTRAAFDCGRSTCTATSMVPVGTKPAGDGRWGHSEMAGNVAEWVMDWSPTVLYKNPCVDCVETNPGIYRGQRGGDYYEQANRITTAYRSYDEPAMRRPLFGVRCARAAK